MPGCASKSNWVLNKINDTSISVLLRSMRCANVLVGQGCQLQLLFPVCMNWLIVLGQ